MKHIDLRAQWVLDMRDSAENISLHHIAGVDNPANFFTKVLGPIDFQKESEHLMSTVELSEKMREAMKPKQKDQGKKTVKFHSGGMEITKPAARELTDSAARELPGTHQMKRNAQVEQLNKEINGADFLGKDGRQTPKTLTERESQNEKIQRAGMCA